MLWLSAIMLNALFCFIHIPMAANPGPFQSPAMAEFFEDVNALDDDYLPSRASRNSCLHDTGKYIVRHCCTLVNVSFIVEIIYSKTCTLTHSLIHSFSVSNSKCFSRTINYQYLFTICIRITVYFFS